MQRKNLFKSFICVLLTLLMLVTAVPTSVFAAPASDIPEDMLNSYILDALEYTGYDVQAQRDDGSLFQDYGIGQYVPESVRSDIFYGAPPTGAETVADSSTKTGKAPDIGYFEDYGLVCASFVTYYLCNYLPNIEGFDTQYIYDAVKATGANFQQVYAWQVALNNLADEGKVEKVSSIDKLEPGDIITFGDSENPHIHIGVYAGRYRGLDFMVHVGNDRGPEVMRVDWMIDAGDKSSYANGFYHIELETPVKEGIIQVHKKDEDGNNLAGAYFKVYDTNVDVVDTIGPTDKKGIATSDYLLFGTYTVVETVFPEGYTAGDKTSWTVTIDEDHLVNGIVAFEAINKRVQWQLHLTKHLADGYDSNYSLRGAVYTLYKDGEEVASYTTDAHGKFTTDVFDYDDTVTYTLKETKAPEGYRINNSEYNLNDYLNEKINDTNALIDIELDADEYPSGGQVRIRKKSEIKYTDYPGNYEFEAGAEFVVYNSSFDSYETAVKVGDKKYFDSCVTNERGLSVWQNGETCSRALVPGEYIVEQTKSAHSGLAIMTPQTITIKKDTVEDLVYGDTYYNEWITKPVELIKVDAETGKTITDFDASFQIREADTGELVVFKIGEKYNELTEYDTFTTVDGVAELPLGLPYGNYELVEIKSPDGYYLKEEPVPFTVSEENSSPIKVKMENEPKKGTITLSKKGMQFTDVTTSESDYGEVYKAVFTDEYLAGAVFDIIADEDVTTNDGTVRYTKGTVVDTLTTTSEGPVTSKELYPGNYVVVETKVPEGYIKAKEVPATVVAGEDNDISNEVLNIYNDRGSIYVSGEKTASVWVTEEKDGTVTSTQETKPGVGFTFGLYANEDIKGTTDNAIIKKDSLVDVVVTDEKGKINFKGEYAFGNYYIKELAAPSEDYVLSASKYEVSLTPDNIKDEITITISLKDTIHNDTKPGLGKVIKIDAETKEPMEGILIQIKDTKGKVWYKGYTDKNGELNFWLESGNYVAQELETKEGYILDNKEYPFTVVPGNVPAVVTIENVPQKGLISIEKYGTQFVSLKEVKTEFGTAYQPVYEDKYLAGVEFEIRAKEDIISPDGKVQYKSGDVVQTLVSTSTGAVTSDELWPGVYEVVETKTLNGYKIDSVPREITVKAEENKEVTTYTEKYYNSKATAEINAIKRAIVWKNNENGEIVNRELIDIAGVGFTFGLYTAEDIALYNGEEGLKKDTLVATAVSDENGYIKFALDLPFGEYYVKELAAPEVHYTIPDTKYPVSVKTTDTTGETIVIKATAGDIINDFPKFPVVITKTDLVTSEPVPGALVEIRDNDNNVVYREYTTEDGTLPNIILEPGNYVFEEIVAPEGYIRNTTIFDFTVKADGTINGKVDFTNTPTQVTVTKTDAVAGKPVAGAEITIYEAKTNEATADELGKEVAKEITDKNGQINVSYLEIGKWYIYKETKAANGFAVNKNTFTFMINEDGTITGDTTLVDDYTRFMIYKVNEKDKPMKGVVFTMYDEQGNPVATATTDEAGVAEFVGFLEGKYTIKETKTWDNYDLAPDSIKIVNDGNWDNEAETSSATVKNYPTVIPPKTGDNNNLLFYGIGTGVSLACLLGVVIVFIIKNKKRIED